MSSKPFDPLHSPLELQHELLQRFVTSLTEALGSTVEICGIIEFGSFAKGEAVSSSDIDTRIYLSSPDRYFRQGNISRFDQSQQNALDKRYRNFENKYQVVKRQEYDWWKFNNVLTEKLTEMLGVTIEFGLVDYRYVSFEFDYIETHPTNEHALLLQSNTVYDPSGKIASLHNRIKGKRYESQASFYQSRYLDSLPFEIYHHLIPDSNDDFKIKKSRQIQWVKWAVRCLRDAVAAKSYRAYGEFIYKKQDVLQFYEQHLPEYFESVQNIYSWKTDEAIREEMVSDFLSHKEKYFQCFKDMMPELEEIISKVKKLELKK